MYAIYDIKNKEQCMGIFDYREDAAKYLGIHKDSLSRCIQRKQLIKNRYEVIKIKEE